LGTVTKISTNTGSVTTPNGLATPAVVLDPSNPSEVKYAYAGDLLGNLWKFDVNAGTLAYKLFTATSPSSGNPVQPITSRPEVALHPDRGYLVYFGTGKYIESTDNSPLGQNTQTLYAIWDRAWGETAGDTPATPGALAPQTRAHLLRQDISPTSPYNVNPHSGYYVISDNPINWHNPLNSNPTSPPPPTTHVGCYVDLVFGTNNQGERQVTNPLLREGQIIFNTLIPSTGKCDAGGSSNTIILDGLSCGRLTVSPFKGVPEVTGDFDGDGTSETVPVSSVASGVGILSEPKALQNLEAGDENLLSLGSTGNPSSVELDPLQRTFGRQFWRQLQQ
jgi:type IV pilus assembly protein PilY1